MAQKSTENQSDAEATERMNDALRRALSTPPQKHKDQPKKRAERRQPEPTPPSPPER